MKNFTEIKDRVRQYMEDFPSTRDNSDELLARIWYSDIIRMFGNDKAKSLTFKDALSLLKDGKLSSIGSVSRSWRKWQESPEHGLRGKKWLERQITKTDEAKKQIRSKKNWKEDKDTLF